MIFEAGYLAGWPEPPGVCVGTSGRPNGYRSTTSGRSGGRSGFTVLKISDQLISSLLSIEMT
jgi:hypothetical protein